MSKAEWDVHTPRLEQRIEGSNMSTLSFHMELRIWKPGSNEDKANQEEAGAELSTQTWFSLSHSTKVTLGSGHPMRKSTPSPACVQDWPCDQFSQMNKKLWVCLLHSLLLPAGHCKQHGLQEQESSEEQNLGPLSPRVRKSYPLARNINNNNAATGLKPLTSGSLLFLTVALPQQIQDHSELFYPSPVWPSRDLSQLQMCKKAPKHVYFFKICPKVYSILLCKATSKCCNFFLQKKKCNF